MEEISQGVSRFCTNHPSGEPPISTSVCYADVSSSRLGATGNVYGIDPTCLGYCNLKYVVDFINISTYTPTIRRSPE